MTVRLLMHLLLDRSGDRAVHRGGVPLSAAEAGLTDPYYHGASRYPIFEGEAVNRCIRFAEAAMQVREQAGDVIGMPPDEVVLAPPRAIPKTSSGKLQRAKCRELYLEEALDLVG